MMITTEERLRVLQMVERGQLSARKAARLLEVLERRDAAHATESGVAGSQRQTAKPPRRLRVRVTDLQTGKPKIDITMPWSLVSVALAMGARFTPPAVDVDFTEVVGQLEGGAVGKVMDVVGDQEQERVEIFVE
jgi:hypothetical protein